MKQKFGKFARRTMPKVLNVGTYVGVPVAAALMIHHGADTVDTFDATGDAATQQTIEVSLSEIEDAKRTALQDALDGASMGDQKQSAALIADLEQATKTRLLLNTDISEETLSTLANNAYDATGDATYQRIAAKARFHDECRLDHDPIKNGTSVNEAADRIGTCMDNSSSDYITPLIAFPLIFSLLLPLHRIPSNVYNRTVGRNRTLREWEAGNTGPKKLSPDAN